MKNNLNSAGVGIGGGVMIAAAMGFVAVGAFAIGALTIRRLAIWGVAVDRASLKSLKIEDLTVTRLHESSVTKDDSESV